jgi:hypothetical protein
MEDRDRYLERELPGRDYKVFRAIDRNLPRESFILFGSLGNPGFLCKRRYHSDALFENRTLAAILREARGPDDVLSAFGRRGFTHLLFRWENVFDPSERRSEIPYPDQEKLAAFLNRHGRLLVEAGRTCLYEIAPRVGPQGAGP